MKLTLILTEDAKAGSYEIDTADLALSATLTLDNQVQDDPPAPEPIPEPTPGPEPIPEPDLVPDPTPEPVPGPAAVMVQATFADGTTASLSLLPGERKPFVAGDVSHGSVVYHADGLSVCIENRYAGLTGDISGHFTVTAGDAVLFDGDLIVWAYRATRPFWLKQPARKASPDLSLFPKYGPGSEQASMIAAYLKGDNGPMGQGMYPTGIGSGGERAPLGPLPQPDACYVVNPSDDNATVVRGMADACAPYVPGVIDLATNKMLNVQAWPKATTMVQYRGAKDNPIQKYTTACKYDMDQAQTHATNYCALACELYGTDYDREQLALWCNYVNSLWQNPAYRSPNGSSVFSGIAQRGKARGLIVLLFAAAYAPDEWKPYFKSWLCDASEIGLAKWVNGQSGIQIDQTLTYDNGASFAPWQQHLLVYAVGMAIQHGHKAFQPILDYFAPPVLDSILSVQHEFSTQYTVRARDANGRLVATWAEALAATAAGDPKLAAALQCAEGSQALQDAWGHTAKQGYVPGDFGSSPTAPDGYTAQMQGALAMCARYATNQELAQAAWAKFLQYRRCDYSKNPKYNLVP